MKEGMDRRSFIKGSVLGVAVGATSIGTTGLLGCTTTTPPKDPGTSNEPSMKDGTYNAKSHGFFGDVSVEMTVKSKAISDLAIGHTGETGNKGGVAITRLTPLIKEANGLKGVDAITGATATSRAVFRCIENCLQQAGALEQPGDVVMKPGSYCGDARGFGWIEPIRVKIEVSESKLLSVEVIEKDLNREEPLIQKSAEDLMIPRMIASQSVTVDSITGATSTSCGIRTATEMALRKALAAGGSNDMAIHNFFKDTVKVDKTETLDYDVVICGLGGAGSCAAMSTAEAMVAAGRKVSILAIETAGKYGGTASNAGEPFSVNPPRYLAKYNNGVKWCDYDSLYADWIKTYSKGTPCKPEFVKMIMDESGKTTDWLQFDHGFVFTNGMAGFGTATWLAKQQYVYKTNMVKDRDYAKEHPEYTFGDRSTTIGQYYDRIISDFTKLGGKYMLETQAYELMLDSSGNSVVGVKAKSNVDGTEYVVNARTVILATGGFCGDTGLHELYLKNPQYPLAAQWQLWGMYQNKGQMIVSSINKGAGTYNIDMAPCIHFKTTSEYITDYPVYYRDGLEEREQKQNTWSLNDIPMLMGINASALQVGADGKRHYNEAGTFAFWAGGPSWFTIYGSDYVDNLAKNGYAGNKGTFQGSTKVFGQGGYPNGVPIPYIYEALETAEKHGYVFKADTLQELAEKMGVPPADFVAQVERYEKYCKDKKDEEFGKAERNLISQINKAPYYAVKADATPYSTIAALNIDTDINVTKADGKTRIKGLFACGNDSGGVLYTNLEPYAQYGGVALGWAFTSGRLVGEKAVGYLKTL